MNAIDTPTERAALSGSRYAFVASGIIVHAAILLITSIAGVLAAQLWMLLGWAWLLWVPALVLSVRCSSRRLWLPLLIGFALIAPVIPTLLAFTAWSISGFAP
jgi:hypothetical protein